jgi:hypothetical protein
VPFTVLHFPFGFAFSKLDRRLILPGLVVGAVLPDIEVPILWLFFSSLPDHLILHSLLGALTLGTLLAVLVTRFLYPPLISWIFGVERKELDEKCRLTPVLVISCMLGLLSHLALDIPMHTSNAVLWPWVDPSAVVGILALIFAVNGDLIIGFSRSNLLLSVIMLMGWLTILLYYRDKDLWTQVWLGTNRCQLND